MCSLLRDALRGSGFFLAVAALGASSFMGGMLASRTMRDPVVLLIFLAMIASLGAVLSLGEQRRGGDRRA